MFNFNVLQAGATGSSPMPIWLLLIIYAAFFGLLYFIMIRPQQKRKKKEEAMRKSAEIGDEITTIGGIIGEIVSIKEETVTIETSKAGTKIRFLKSAIRSVDVSAEDKKKAAEEK